MLQPDNIFVFVTDFGVRVKLGDLSRAKVSSIAAPSLFDLGNEKYRAPEVFKGTFSGKADVYSVGLVLTELVLQHFTFPGFDRISDPLGTHDCLDILQERLSTVSPELAEVLVKCCAPDPADRLTSSEALIGIRVRVTLSKLACIVSYVPAG